MNLDQSLKAIHAEPVQSDLPHHIAPLWEKVRPMVAMLAVIMGKKVKPYINAFVAAIDAIVQEEDV